MIAAPAHRSAVGDEADIKDDVSLSSDCSSISRRASWVVANEGISTAPLGTMVWSGWESGGGFGHVRL